MSTNLKTVLELLTYPDAGQLDLAIRLSGFAALLSGLSAPEIDATERVVAADTVSLTDANGAAQYGIVHHVEATTGGTTGAVAIVLDKVPATGEVKLEYVSGQPKLTFAAADAVTGAKVHWTNTGAHNGNSMAANLATEVGAG